MRSAAWRRSPKSNRQPRPRPGIAPPLARRRRRCPARPQRRPPGRGPAQQSDPYPGRVPFVQHFEGCRVPVGHGTHQHRVRIGRRLTHTYLSPRRPQLVFLSILLCAKKCFDGERGARAGPVRRAGKRLPSQVA